MIGWLVNLVHKPYKYEVKPGTGPGSTATLFVDGELFDRQRLYRFPDVDVRVIPNNIISVWSIAARIAPNYGLLAQAVHFNALQAASLSSRALEGTRGSRAAQRRDRAALGR